MVRLGYVKASLRYRGSGLTIWPFWDRSVYKDTAMRVGLGAAKYYGRTGAVIFVTVVGGVITDVL